MKIKINNIYCTVEEPTVAQSAVLNLNLSCFAPGYKYSLAFKRKVWNGRVSLYKKGTFPTGCLPSLLKLLPGTVELEDCRSIPNYKLNPNLTIPLRDYQVRIANTCFSNALNGLRWNRGVIQACCASGKTTIAAAMIQIAQIPSLFIVDSNELLTQALETFQQYGISAGSSIDSGNDVNVITIQSLMQFRHKTNKKTESGRVRTKEEIEEIKARKAIKGELTIEYLNKIEAIYVDECHGIAASVEKGNLLAQALELMPNAYMRWGLTATPFERDEYSNLILEGSTGKRLVEVTTKELIDAGYIAAPKITMYSAVYENIPTSYPNCYTYGVVLNEKRNNMIVSQAIARDKPCLVQVQSLDHGRILKEKFNREGYDVPFFSGQDDNATRQKGATDVKKGLLPIVIVSEIWDKGVSLPAVRTVILAGGGASSVQTKQKIGRGMRLSKDKTTFEVVDFIDKGNPTLVKHSNARKKTYVSEGYDVSIKSF